MNQENNTCFDYMGQFPSVKLDLLVVFRGLHQTNTCKNDTKTSLSLTANVLHFS